MADVMQPTYRSIDWAKQFGELLSSVPEGLFLQVVEQAPIAISITDLNANICYANQRFSQLTGYSLKELKGQNQRMLSSHQTPKECYQTLWKQITSGKVWSGKLVNRTRGGTDYLAEITIAPVFDSEDAISHFIGIQRDISQSYQLTQELSNQKADFESVLNATDSLTVVFDENEKVILDNLAYKTMRTDLSGSEPLSFIAQQMQQQLQMPLSDLQASHEPVTIEYWVRGEKKWLSLSCQPLAHVNEQASHYFSHDTKRLYVLIAQDCTADHQLLVQNHLEQLQGQLSDSKMLAAIRETLQTAAYQLSQPINLLYAMVRLNHPFSDRSSDPSKALNEILRSAEQALTTIQGSMPRLKPEMPVCFDMNSLIEDLTLLANSRARRLGVMVQIGGRIDTPLFAPRVRILSALDLVVEHALVAAVKGGHDQENHQPIVNIAFSTDEGQVSVRIDDNGPLLSKEACHRIMQPFYNRELLRNEFGLGLCLARDVILENGGTMDVVPVNNGGSRVILTLPVKKEREAFDDRELDRT
ncbi:nitrogen fixation negative regulator NifL [Celerinatantimonas diazotrophica]|uniref:histidine kinase n=1 Tax=Celerinatantimonas diazotrophica TaxID=412034 RepID=A0A4R1K3N7_9GAMM|nr:nitrogen fixation negative regulator NifL [Celerinatantimonas diazotrophica]TCK58507.1 nitrogen fixation negative regulator NifL [Celerinatantimonas diazotrophica]CAG9297136.1 Nitrogen fixation regulatory protein [Celerinatantimonas diazotrophica]